MAYVFEEARDDGRGGIKLQWKDTVPTPTPRLMLRLSSDGKLSMVAFDKDRVNDTWETTTKPSEIVKALRGLLL